MACTIVMRRQLRLKSYFSEDQTLFLEPGRGTVLVFCELSRQAETNPLNAGHNDLANYNRRSLLIVPLLYPDRALSTRPAIVGLLDVSCARHPALAASS